MNKFLIQAEKIMENKLNYIHLWDMERCEKYYDIPTDWNETPNSDDEWVFMRSRMGYFDGLILSYKKTKDKKYIEKILEIINDYINTHKILKYEKSNRTLDAGIRIVNILRVLIFLENEKLKFDKKIISHLDKTCEYLFNSYESKYDQSNWGLIQMIGVYTYSLYFDDKEKMDKSYKYLKTQLKTQILDDGLHWEKSSTYHYQIVIYLIWCVYISKLKKEKKNIVYFKKYLEKLTEAAKKLHYPDNTQINFGDSDDNEIESILSLSDYILSKNSEYKLTDISKMFIPIIKFKKKENLKNKERKVFNLKSSGYYHIIDKDFSFSCYLTPMSSSHTHIDLLHFNYYNKNKIFVDTGRYTYVENEYRKNLKSQFSHNSVIIDGKPASNILASWEYENYPIVFPINSYKSSDFDVVELGMFDKTNSSLIIRKFLILGKNVIIINIVKCRGEHSLEFRYNLYPNTKIKEEGKNILLNNKVLFKTEDYKIIKGLYSSKYNEIEEIDVIYEKYNFRDEYFSINTILEKNVFIEKLDVYQKNIKVDDNIAQAFRIKHKNTSYIIFVKSEETYKNQKVFHVNKIPFYGNIKCIKEK